MGRRKKGVSQEQASAALAVPWRQILTDEAGAQITDARKRSIAQKTSDMAPSALR